MSGQDESLPLPKAHMQWFNENWLSFDSERTRLQDSKCDPNQTDPVEWIGHKYKEKHNQKKMGIHDEFHSGSWLPFLQLRRRFTTTYEGFDHPLYRVQHSYHCLCHDIHLIQKCYVHFLFTLWLISAIYIKDVTASKPTSGVSFLCQISTLNKMLILWA